jgi:very-short-patch-repair endonuclease
MGKKLTTYEFIIKANEKHNNKYDYSLSKYIGANEKIKIICSKHGEFEQTASSHLKGQGCKQCFFHNRRITNYELINKFNLVHNNKYDYSLIDYKNIHIKISIICPIHGEFKQRPNNHLHGKGCLKCGGSEKSNVHKFIERANLKHNNKYDYTKVDYINGKTKVKIICSEHGEFEQMPCVHLRGNGCKKCSNKIKQNYKKITLSEFKNKSNLKHNNKYDYSLINDIDLNKKYNIICPIHGEFKQKLRNHLYQGNGCPRCKDSKGEIEISKWLLSKNIKFNPQHRFKDCRYIKPLPFDFYLPDYNICIEYDGEQHYKIIKKFGGVNNFIKIKKRDKIKTEYCIKNKIKLLRIKYNENILDCLNFNLKQEFLESS